MERRREMRGQEMGRENRREERRGRVGRWRGGDKRWGGRV